MRLLIPSHCRGALACMACLVVGLSCSPAMAVFTEEGATWLGGANLSGRSASLADIDNDGDLDLFFQGATGSQQLFVNNTINPGGTSSHTFTNVTSTMLPSGLTSSWSAAWGDYNGDGKVDVFVGQTNSSPTTGMLLQNTGSGFVDASSATGLNDPNFAQNVAWGDFNNDHMLDLMIGMESTDGKPGTGGGNQLYLQGPAGHFTPVGTSVGIQNPVSVKAYGMAIGDYDGDGDLDVYISTCTGSGSGVIANAFYKNMLKETGTLSFVDVAASNGTQNTGQTYGAQFVDLDNDGKLDLWVVGSDGNPTKIYKNMGNGQFVDVDTITGHPLLSDTGTDLNGGAAIDYDNDGKLDLFFHDNMSGTANVKLYHNDSYIDPTTHQYVWQFTDVSADMGLTKTATTSDPGAGGYDSTWGDIDLDGDLDLINPNNQLKNGVATPERVYINDASTNGNHWLYVMLHGPDWNTTAIGSSLYATLNVGTSDEVTLRREANTNAGTFNQSDVPVHFGLGASDVVDWLRVVWPDGTVQFLHDVSADQYLSLSFDTALPGDFSGDGVVDAADYVLWRKYYGSPFTMDDYNTWRAHLGETLSSGTATTSSVPEPAAATLILAAAMAAVVWVRRRPAQEI